MSLELKDRVAVITGSSRGIGLETARVLARDGARVLLCARDKKELEDASRSLTEAGADCAVVKVDLSRTQAAKRVIGAAWERWGRLDILVNNVGGIPRTGQFEFLSDADWDDCYRLNLLSAVRFCREAIPYLRKSRCGRIINLSSMVAAQPGSFNPHYSAMKAGLLNLTKHLSGVLAVDNILVNSVSPGIIHTEGWDSYISGKAQSEGISMKRCRSRENRRAVKQVPLKRLGTRTEVAELIAFLASDKAGFITGANHRVDGGRVASIV